MNRLKIPTLFIKTPLYEATTGAEAQGIVDAPQSAVIFAWWGFPVIADHSSQGGMYRLRSALPRLTKAYVDGTTYVCVFKKRGVIRGADIIVDGKRVRDAEADLCIYTCTGRKPKGETEVWVTYWRHK